MPYSFARQLRVALLFCLPLCQAMAAPGISVWRPVMSHTPQQPRSGEAVTVTVRFEPGLAVSNATLKVQVVEPGYYIRKTDSTYTNQWQEIPLHDDGLNGDIKKEDHLFTGVIPGELQQHRRLIRFFVQAPGSLRFPDVTNPCPNDAYFVYDGMPAWTGANQPGKTEALTFSAPFMQTLRAYHVIAQNQDVEQSQWDGGYNRRPFLGTLVCEGKVYDHIQFANRGKASTHLTGKNKWSFRFSEPNLYLGRDLWGQPYSNAWKNLSLTACASPWVQINRGMAGLEEALSFRSYQLAGVPSASTHWIQLRVISHSLEINPNNQYEGDVWGLYQVVQEPNREWLQQRGLTDGDIYSPETGLKHRANLSPTNDVAWQSFLAESQTTTSEAWWRSQFDLKTYYTFHALNRVLSNIDLRPEANHYFYHAPSGRWQVIPWDLDMMFVPREHQPGYIHQTRCLEIPAFKLEYQNRAREILDLFCSDQHPAGGQIGQLADELARFLVPPESNRSWPELDMCAWNHHPRNQYPGQFYLNPAQDSRGGGEWSRTLASADFAGFCRYIVDFCTDSRPVKNYAPNDGDPRGYGYGYLTFESRDPAIPQRPQLQKAGERKAGVSGDHISLQVSPFTPAPSPAAPPAPSSPFAAIQWRLGEISAPGRAGYVAGAPRKYEIEEAWSLEEKTEPGPVMKLPLQACQVGHTYRARARYKDASGRWSHWSEPVQFVKE